MADPVVVETPKDVWTKVVTGATAFTLHKLLKTPNVYLYTYRSTGTAAPTDVADAIPLVDLSSDFSYDTAVDAYIRPIGVDGRVRSDVL